MEKWKFLFMKALICKQVLHNKPLDTLYVFLFNDTRRQNCVLLNIVQEFHEIEAWLFLTFFLCLHNQLISTHSIFIY